MCNISNACTIPVIPSRLQLQSRASLVQRLASYVVSRCCLYIILFVYLTRDGRSIERVCPTEHRKRRKWKRYLERGNVANGRFRGSSKPWFTISTISKLIGTMISLTHPDRRRRSRWKTVILRDGMWRVLAIHAQKWSLPWGRCLFAPARRYNSIQDDEHREVTLKRNSIRCNYQRKTNYTIGQRY